MKKLTALMLALMLALAMVPGTALADATVNTPAELTAALAAGGEIILGANIDAGTLTQGTFFTVPAGITVTLDLNGKTLEGTRVAGSIGPGNRNTAIISNSGTLTIKDSVGGGKIVIDATNNDSWNSCTAAVSNSGLLTIQSGTLQNLGGTDMAYALDSLSGSVAPVVYITGGTIRSETYRAVRLFANSITQQNTVNVTGGTIYGPSRGIWVHQPQENASGLATVNISGGTIEAQNSAVSVDIMASDGVDINITGGTLINHKSDLATVSLYLWDDSYANKNYGGVEVTISGGTFTNTASGPNLLDGARTVDPSTTHPNVISVLKGSFSAMVPAAYIAPTANPDDIVVGKGSEVIAKADVAYIVVIPSSVNFGTISKSMPVQSRDFKVEVQNALIEDGYSITVTNTTAKPMTMRDKDGSGSNTLAFVLEKDLFKFAYAALADGAEIIASTISCTPANLTAAGSYKGTMTFSITYGVYVP